MGPEFWRHPTHGLKKCSERTRDFCTDHLDCCAVTPCTYCLELEFYGGIIYYGTADQSANHWTGFVNGHSFDAFWDRNYTTDECEFVVELDGEEVYRNDCYGGQSCRDSSDEAEVEVDYEAATLRWIKHEPLPLPHITDPDTGCKTWFCGECECSCECVCVTITEPDSTVITGELCNVAYECEGPRWEGQIGYFDLALALGRDSYGNCVLESTINGEEQDAVEVTGCKNMSATITLYDGTMIQVSCKVCSCELDDSCCGLRGVDSLTLVYTGISTGWGPGETVGVRYTIWSVTLTAAASWYRSDVPNPYDPTDLYVVYMTDGGSNDLECVGLTSASWWGGGFSRFFPVGTGVNEWTCPGNFGLIKPYSLTPPDTGFDGYYTDIEITIV